MKVLHVIPAVAPSYGGPSQAVFEICQALMSQGVEAEIAATNANLNGTLDVPLNEKIQFQGVPTYFLDRTLKTEYKFSVPLTQWLKRNIPNYNLLHIHSVFCFPTTVAAYYARKYRIPYMIRPAGILDSWPMRQHLWRKKIYFNVVEKENLNQATAIHYTSEKEKLSAERLGVSAKGVVVPLGLQLDAQYQAIPKGSFKQKFQEIGDRRLIIFLSRIDPKKGLELLIEALAGLKKSRPDFFLAVAGSGKEEYLKILRKKIKDLQLEKQVLFAGHLQGEAKYELLRDADLFVLPSYQENFGFAVVEALAMGIPVVVSDQVDISKEIEAYRAGKVVPCDVKSLALAVDELLDNEKEKMSMGENARRLFLEKFSREKMAIGLINLYQSILAVQQINPCRIPTSLPSF